MKKLEKDFMKNENRIIKRVETLITNYGYGVMSSETLADKIKDEFEEYNKIKNEILEKVGQKQ